MMIPKSRCNDPDCTDAKEVELQKLKDFETSEEESRTHFPLPGCCCKKVNKCEPGLLQGDSRMTVMPNGILQKLENNL